VFTDFYTSALRETAAASAIITTLTTGHRSREVLRARRLRRLTAMISRASSTSATQKTRMTTTTAMRMLQLLHLSTSVFSLSVRPMMRYVCDLISAH
jgi:hypothetical protein